MNNWQHLLQKGGISLSSYNLFFLLSLSQSLSLPCSILFFLSLPPSFPFLFFHLPLSFTLLSCLSVPTKILNPIFPSVLRHSRPSKHLSPPFASSLVHAFPLFAHCSLSPFLSPLPSVPPHFALSLAACVCFVWNTVVWTVSPLLQCHGSHYRLRNTPWQHTHFDPCNHTHTHAPIICTPLPYIEPASIQHTHFFYTLAGSQRGKVGGDF